MSVFRGSVIEYPGVIIDHFVPSNCERGRAFFLSHCHRDHMTGLGSTAIVHALQARQTSFHCSEVTRALLLKDPEFTSLAPYLKALPMEQPVAMTLDALSNFPMLSFTVTLLPAGHCPGSVMFLFQGAGGNVLYTGDFRLTLEETQRLRPLHSNKCMMDIFSLYLDTTFFHPIAAKLPSREIARDKILEITESWLAKDVCNVVLLHCASFGYEHILMGVANKCQTKVHIARWRIEAYADLPAVADCITSDGNSTRVHCCVFRRGGQHKSGQLPCSSCPVPGKKPCILYIKPSTIWFLSASCSLSDPFVFFPQYNSYRVLHSMHASYEELCQFLHYLKPRRVVPCVVPVGDTSLADVRARVALILPQCEVDTSAITDDAKRKEKIKKRNLEDRFSSLEKRDELWSTAEEDIGNVYSMNSQKHFQEKNETQSFISCTGSVALRNSRFLLPSMLEVSGGVIAPPRRGSDAAAVGAFLEQSPLDLDSSEEDPSETAEPINYERLSQADALSQTTISSRPDNRTANYDQITISKTNHVIHNASPTSMKPCLLEWKKHSEKGKDKLDILNKEHHIQANRDLPTLEKCVPNNDHHNLSSTSKTYSNKEAATVDDSSDSHQEGESESSCSRLLVRSRSPTVLPLTPGKEDIESILQRKNMALF